MAKWEKGHSGNAGGRPKEIGDLRAKARERTEEALETLAEVMLDKDAPPNARVAASTALLDRGYGKPTTIIEAPPKAPAISIEEAARRLAFALNSAALLGQPVDDKFTEVLPGIGIDAPEFEE